jgi:hypothetical protein
VIDTTTVLAWNPNGHVLAAYNAGKSVNLFDCTNGDRLASLVLKSKDAASPAEAPLIRRSTGGSHLLISSVLWAW